MINKSEERAVSLADFHDGSFPEASTPITSTCVFGQLTWDLSDSSLARQDSVGASKLRMQWEIYLSEKKSQSTDHRDAHVSRTLLEELRILGFFYFKAPAHLGSSAAEIKPNSLVPMLRALICLFSRIDSSKRSLHDDLLAHHLVNTPHTMTASISEVSFEELRDAISNSPRRDGNLLKTGLKLLCSPLLNGRFGSPLQWNLDDISSLDFTYSEKRIDYQKLMPDELFRLLSNTATDDVRGFLTLVGVELQDKSPIVLSGLAPEIDGETYFPLYIQMRDRDRSESHRCGRKVSHSKTLRRRLDSLGLAPSDFFRYLLRVRNAAFSLIGIYTGARWSDFSGFKHGCVKDRHGFPVLRGTVVKNKPAQAPEDSDYWPAIPILRDSVAVLELFSRVTHNEFLFSSSDTVPIGGAQEAISLVGFTTAINNYLQLIDVNEEWSSWHVHPHQLRHTLARQLANADLGTVFISYQLKHLYTALAALPADITLGYGNLAQQRLDRAAAHIDANLDAVRALFDPTAPVAGGGAHEFRSRRKAYFEGKAAAGWSVEETIQQLATAGIPFSSVGPGYCGGVREEILKDGSKSLPPCLGDLQCNPGECGQAVITVIHKRNWERILEKNQELSKIPELSYARDRFTASISTAKRVLADLT